MRIFCYPLLSLSDSSRQSQEGDSSCQSQEGDLSYQSQEGDSSCQSQEGDSSYQSQNEKEIEECLNDLTNENREDSKQYDCGFCQKQFSHKASLNRHKKRHQEIREQHFCGFCGENFTRLDNLQKHEKTKHLNKDSNTLTFKNNFIKFDEEIKSCDTSQVKYP